LAGAGTVHLSAQQCASYTVDVTPEPIAGIYYAGTVVEYCVEVSMWDGQAYNPGGPWLPLNASSGTVAANVCSSSAGGVGWQWVEHPTLGWGWFFEAPLNFTPIDTDPSNNHGDANSQVGGANCQWSFCFEMETSSCPPGTDGASLDMAIDLYSDGESGAWTATTCSADDIYNAPTATLACCSNPMLLLSTDAQDGSIDICASTELDLGAEVDLDLTSFPAGATNIDYYWEGPNLWESNDKTPTVLIPSAGAYSVVVEVDGCSSVSYNINVNIIPPLNLDWTANN